MNAVTPTTDVEALEALIDPSEMSEVREAIFTEQLEQIWVTYDPDQSDTWPTTEDRYFVLSATMGLNIIYWTGEHTYNWAGVKRYALASDLTPTTGVLHG